VYNLIKYLYHNYKIYEEIIYMEYKVVELATVTDIEIENVINEWTAQGWEFEYVQFAIREASKRPSMAFLFFTKEESDKH